MSLHYIILSLHLVCNSQEAENHHSGWRWTPSRWCITLKEGMLCKFFDFPCICSCSTNQSWVFGKIIGLQWLGLDLPDGWPTIWILDKSDRLLSGWQRQKFRYPSSHPKFFSFYWKNWQEVTFPEGSSGKLPPCHPWPATSFVSK